MSRLTILLILLLAGQGTARASGEEEAYRMLQVLHQRLQAAGAKSTTRPLAIGARRFLKSHPGSRHGSTVNLWLGDALVARDPVAALAAYRRSSHPDAIGRAAELILRYETGPPLQALSWVGRPMEPCRARDEVVALVFLGLTHPQTGKALPHLLRLHRRFGGAGLKICGVAAIVDDHANQEPAVLEARIRRLGLPFPFAIDRARRQGPSVSFQLYRGSSLPWVVIFDRYGRIAWLGAASPGADSMARIERHLRTELNRPTFAELAASIRQGDRAALDELGSIRTKETVTTLLKLLQDDLPRDRRTGVRRALEGLGPLELAHGPAALQSWELKRGGYRYSLARDRVVQRR